PLGLLRGRVARASHSHQRLDAEALHDRLRVEVAVAGEESAPSERAADLLASHAVDRERNSGRARVAERWTVETHAADRRQSVPEACGESLSFVVRSEEHTSELQSRGHLVCRLLLEK